MTRRIKSRWIPLLTISILCVGNPWAAGQDEFPRNRALIAAMPPGTESVLLTRYDVLTAEYSVLRKEAFERIDGLTEVSRLDDRNHPLEVISRYIAMSVPLIHVEGGSEFTAPRDIGVGKYNSRSIWVVKESLGKLIKRLNESRGIQGELRRFELNGAQAFEFAIEQSDMDRNGKGKPIFEKCFVAFPNDRTVVITESRADLEAMLKGLATKRSTIPQKWESLATGLDIESPIVLLRRYNPNNDRDLTSRLISRVRLIGTPMSTDSGLFFPTSDKSSCG